MITAEELVLEIGSGGEAESKSNFKLATVTSLFDNNTAKLRLDGEDAASEKQYAYLANYIPQLNDRVLLCSVGGTYIILGKISYDKEPSSTIDEEISAIKGDIIKIDGNIGTIDSDISDINNEIVELNNALKYKINSNMNDDVNGNMNIDYMYVDPGTGNLHVRRKNGSWSSFAKV